VLFTDATILTETPPRACWSPRGEQAAVPATGGRAQRVLYGALNVGTGAACLDRAAARDQVSFRRHLWSIRSLGGGGASCCSWAGAARTRHGRATGWRGR
jgi:hypothetical protein